MRSSSKLVEFKHKMNETFTRTLPSVANQMRHSKTQVFTESTTETSDHCKQRSKTPNNLLNYRQRMASFRRSVSKKSITKHNSIQLNDNKFRLLSTSSHSSLRLERITNQIAAKLLSENIELSKHPYTDEMGFCKIPKALVKRYAFEMNQHIQLVSNSMENERLIQLEKSGKLGVT